MAEAKRDNNRIPTLLGVSSADGVTPVTLYADPTTHRLYVDLPAGTGDVVGPAVAVDENITVFDATTGKLIKDSGIASSNVVLLGGRTGGQIIKGGIANGEDLSFWTNATGVIGDYYFVDLTTNGFLKTNDATGKLSVDTDTYVVTGSALLLDQTTAQTITNDSPIFNTLTASELVATDGSKKLQSLAVATYPSLTELAYVKGVTSAIQDQIDAVSGNEENTYTVSPTGGDYETIQEALDDNVTVGTLFLVYPGTYTNDTINFKANNQCVKGVACSPKNVLVTKATTISDYGAFTGCVVDNIKMVMTLAANAVGTTVTGTGSCNYKFCHVECIASGTNADVNGGATCYRGTGTVKIVEGSIIYANTANRGARGKKAVLVEDGSAWTIDDVQFTVTGSGTSIINGAIRNNSEGELIVDECTIDVTDNATGKAYGIYVDAGKADQEAFNNIVHVNNSGGNATAVLVGAEAGETLSVRSMYNHLHAVASGTANAFEITNSDTTLISQYDDLLGAVANSGGRYTYVNSSADGVLDVSVGITGDYLTASELLITDASKGIISAPVATYPSLTELSYVKGVTSALQTQINDKSPADSPTFTTKVTGSYLTASELLVTNASKEVVSAPVATYPSLTELSYVKGLTSAVQTQLNGLATEALDNLSGVAINTSLISDTTATDDLGSTTKLWNHTYTTDIELGHATDTTITRTGAGAIAVEGVAVPTISSTNTLTNKRITARVDTYTTDATPDVDTDDFDAVTITAQEVAITDMNFTGTPTNFQKIIVRIKDDGTARAITWGSDFEAKGVALPTTTVISKVLTVGFIYDTVTSKWGCVASAQEA